MTTTTPPPALPARAALFLDFDGTLVALAPRPHDVVVGTWVLPTLRRLQLGLQGALAIVSGRPMAQIDAYLQPMLLPVAGTHGAERRNASGALQAQAATAPAAISACAQALVRQHSGLLFEPKPSGFALHYRARPELETLCLEAMAGALAAEAPAEGSSWELMRGHCVVELKQRQVSKAGAVRAFLGEPVFAGRTPVYIGDDVTDEDGIEAVQAAGGFGIKVGPGATQARHRLTDIGEVERWLLRAADDLGQSAS